MSYKLGMPHVRMFELLPEHLRRVDETDDAVFYSQPRIVKHIDEPACTALTEYFRKTLPPNGEILDLMSSCVSHLPEDIGYKNVVGLGMNQIELEANSRLSSYLIHNLAVNPKMPFVNNSFDACTLTVSVQYVVHPISVFQEIGRVLKPNCPCIVSFSNRCFPPKQSLSGISFLTWGMPNLLFITLIVQEFLAPLKPQIFRPIAERQIL